MTKCIMMISYYKNHLPLNVCSKIFHSNDIKKRHQMYVRIALCGHTHMMNMVNSMVIGVEISKINTKCSK